MKILSAELLRQSGRTEAAIKVAMLADSFATTSIAHSAAASQLVDESKREEALRLVGEAQAYHAVSLRLIALAEELKG